MKRFASRALTTGLGRGCLPLAAGPVFSRRFHLGDPIRSEGTPKRGAECLVQYRKAFQTLDALPDFVKPVTEEASYCIQDEFNKMQTTNGKAIGYKIGATNDGARKTLCLSQPFYGVLFENLTTASGEASTFEANKMYLRVVEPEITLEMGADLDPRDAPFDAKAIQEATSRVIAAFEIVDTPYASKWKEVGGFSLIADNGGHGRWIKGSGVAVAGAPNLDSVKVTLEVNGKVEREGSSANVDGNPYGATAWLATYLASRGIGLKKGDLITTGTTTVPWVGQAGEKCVANFEGIGSVELSFV